MHLRSRWKYPSLLIKDRGMEFLKSVILTLHGKFIYIWNLSIDMVVDLSIFQLFLTSFCWAGNGPVAASSNSVFWPLSFGLCSQRHTCIMTFHTPGVTETRWRHISYGIFYYPIWSPKTYLRQLWEASSLSGIHYSLPP